MSQVRFAVVSDGHWGQQATINGDSPDYEDLHDDVLSRISNIHDRRPIDFVVHCGDIVHDDETLHSEVIDKFFDELPGGIDWYPVYGNHDWSTESEWQDDYGVPWDLTFEYGDIGGIIVGTGEPQTSPGWGSYQPPDVGFLKSAIDDFADKDEVFVFIHVPPVGARRLGFAYDSDSPAVVEQFQRDEVSAVFTGHIHNRNKIIVRNGVKYVYCCRFGGTDTGSNSNLWISDPAVRIVEI